MWLRRVTNLVPSSMWPSGTASERWQADADFSPNLHYIAVNWTGFRDEADNAGGRQIRYAVAIGSSPGNGDVLPWQDAGSDSAESSGRGTLVLSRPDGRPLASSGQRIFICIMAADAAGWTTTACSDGVMLDATPPDSRSSTIRRSDVIETSQGSRVDRIALTDDTAVFSVAGVIDRESPVSALRWRLGTAPGLDDAIRDTDEGPSRAVGGAHGSGKGRFDFAKRLASDAKLESGVKYFLTVAVFNGAGLPSVVIDTDGAFVDATPPSCGAVAVYPAS